MSDPAEKLLTVLSSEIDRKCAEIYRERREKRRLCLFLALCAGLIVVPTVLSLLGISLLWVVVLPVPAASIAFLLLAPVLMQQRGDRHYERI